MILEQFKGAINLKSKLEMGTKFTFVIGTEILKHQETKLKRVKNPMAKIYPKIRLSYDINLNYCHTNLVIEEQKQEEEEQTNRLHYEIRKITPKNIKIEKNVRFSENKSLQVHFDNPISLNIDEESDKSDDSDHEIKNQYNLGRMKTFIKPEEDYFSNRSDDLINERVMEPLNMVRKNKLQKRILMVDDDIFNLMAQK